MKMKRILAVALALAMGLSMISCSQSTEREETQLQQTEQVEQPAKMPEEKPTEKPTEKTKVNLAALSGPTALGMLELLEQNEKGEAANDYQVTLATAPDEVVAKVVSGELDIAAVPTNVAATLYNKTQGGVQLAALNTMGVLYIVEAGESIQSVADLKGAAVPTNVAATLYNKTQGGVQLAALNTMGVLYIVEAGESIQSVADLKGKTIYSTGQGSTPEYALNLVLEKNGLTAGEDVTVVYKTDNSEIAPLLASGEAQVALLPQPFVTSVMGQNETLRVALDMTEEWDKATDGASGLTMGCVVVRTEFAQQNKEALDLFLDEYERSVQTVTSAEGLEHAAQLAEQYNIVKAPVARKAIPACNIVFVQGEQMQQIAGGFLEVLYQANPKSVGGKLPDANFYYNR